jgi:hypothetical protein
MALDLARHGAHVHEAEVPPATEATTVGEVAEVPKDA